SSPGMILAKDHEVDLAPFFIVEHEGKSVVYPSAIKVAKEVLGSKKERMAALSPGMLANPPGNAEQAAPLWTQESVLNDAPRLEGAAAESIVEHVLARLGERCAIAFSGAEDVALIDMAAKSGRAF